MAAASQHYGAPRIALTCSCGCSANSRPTTDFPRLLRLTAFRPDYTSDRAFNVQPSASDAWTLAALELTYRGPGWTLVSSTSFFNRNSQDVEDSTYGTQQVLASGVSGEPPCRPSPSSGSGNMRIARLRTKHDVSFEPVHRLSGTLGIFYSNAHTGFDVPDTYANGLVAATADNTVAGPAPSDLLWTQSNPGMTGGHFDFR